MQNRTYNTKDDQSANEQVSTPKADGTFFDPLNKFTNASTIKRAKLIACFFH